MTTEARPMYRLIAATMLATLLGIVLQLVRDDAPRWVSLVSLILAATPIALAAVHTVPSAVRLGTRDDTTSAQSALAWSVCRDHLVCLVCIAALLVVQLVSA